MDYERIKQIAAAEPTLQEELRTLAHKYLELEAKLEDMREKVEVAGFEIIRYAWLRSKNVEACDSDGNALVVGTGEALDEAINHAVKKDPKFLHDILNKYKI